MVLLIRRATVGGTVTRFAVVLLALVENRLLPITRYDTAHGYAHRDVIGLTEGLRGKLPCRNMTYNQAFEYAIRDIKQNAENYLADFLVH